MTDPLETPPNWPRLAIRIDDRAGTVTLAETITSVAGASLDDTRLHALEVAFRHVARIRRPLHCSVNDPESSQELIVRYDRVVEPPRRSVAWQGRGWLVVTLILLSLVTAGVGVVD